eukprot:6866633-Alexandrium_andersonii.AAC.1
MHVCLCACLPSGVLARFLSRAPLPPSALARALLPRLLCRPCPKRTAIASHRLFLFSGPGRRPAPEAPVWQAHACQVCLHLCAVSYTHLRAHETSAHL